MEFDSIRIKVSEFYRKCKNPRLKCCFWYFIDKIVLGDFLFSHFFPQIFALWKKIQKCSYYGKNPKMFVCGNSILHFCSIFTEFPIFLSKIINFIHFFLTSFKFAWKSVWSDIIPIKINTQMWKKKRHSTKSQKCHFTQCHRLRPIYDDILCYATIPAKSFCSFRCESFGHQ